MSTQPKSKPRLGRGLSSLLSSVELPVRADISSPGENSVSPAAVSTVDGRAMVIAIDSIRPNPHQPRKTIKESAIAELAASIKSSGLIQPLVLRQTPAGLELIAGERRWLAAKLAGLTEVPAIVRDVDAFTQAQMALIENIQREDLNPIERAVGYRSLMEQLGLTQAELAGRMGEDRSGIANFLRLLELSEPIRNLVREGRLSLGHAKLLAGVSNIQEQQRLGELVVSQDLTVRSLERLVQGQPRPAPKPSAGQSHHIQDLEKSLTRQLNMRVQVRAAGKGKGRLILHYDSLDQFDELVAKLGAKTE